MIASPPAARVRGALLVGTSAAFFALTNAASTALYRRGGCSVVSLYLLRSAVIYLANAALIAVREGSTAARGVLLLRTARLESARLVLFRSLLQSTMALGLSVAFVFLTYADAFTVFKGVAVLSTMVMTHACLEHGERLSLYELACGGMTFAGVILVAQPPLLFGHRADTLPQPTPRPSTPQWTPRFGAGIAVAVVSGVISAVCGVLLRVLAKAGGQHDMPPAMLLSFLVCVMFAFFSMVGIVCRVTGLSEAAGWEWSQPVWPASLADWMIIVVHCACTLAAQLSAAAGFATTRAGIAAFLQLTELAWVYALDVFVLGEPTSFLAGLGSAIVFVSAVAAALGNSKK
ncbi:hypothetical protein AB1Y20_016843 [Prymnesium parvum]|uniref:EamA domain-containing protein n=1 Tax=Prymnesium parvum TaxID=97485 RepID=A0AB34ICE6_PRYPA|mmetsp:Transcript_25338/g.38146  ORF Transcript_25338/g.38146 Transcript_25338/m.38146 type:complete len:346 (+) Transcript_25338:23-1060(+)